MTKDELKKYKEMGWEVISEEDPVETPVEKAINTAMNRQQKQHEVLIDIVQKRIAVKPEIKVEFPPQEKKVHDFEVLEWTEDGRIKRIRATEI